MREKTIENLPTTDNRIKAYTFEGKEADKREILLTAGIHGDEATSILVLKQLLSELEERKSTNMRGTLTLIPICNPEAFHYKMRTSPADSQDLNRAFPGNGEGTLTDRIAAELWDVAKERDYILDLHCCGMGCHPYLLTLHDNAKARELTDQIPHEIVIQSHGTEGQLFIEALSEGIPAAILEIGGGKGLVDLKDLDYTKQVVLQTLVNLGFLSGSKERVDQEFLGQIQVLHAQERGLFVPEQEVGSQVNKHQPIGRINGETIQSPLKGRVIRRSQPSIQFEGDALMGIAPFKN